MNNKKIKIIAIIIVLMLIVSTGFGLVAHYSNWFTNWDKFNPFNWGNKSDNKSEMPLSGVYVNPSIENGVSVVSNFETNNIPLEADSGYTLTATINSRQTRNLQLDWFVTWQKESKWSSGKNVSDYLTLSSLTSQSGESITLICNKDFAEKINIVVTSNLDKSRKAICVVDYIKKVKSVRYVINDEEVDLENNQLLQYDFDNTSNTPMTLTCHPVYTDYTLDSKYEINVTGKFTEIFGGGPYGSNLEKKFNSFNFVNGIDVARFEALPTDVSWFAERVSSFHDMTADGNVGGLTFIELSQMCLVNYVSHKKEYELYRGNRYVNYALNFIEAIDKDIIIVSSMTAEEFLNTFKEYFPTKYIHTDNFDFLGDFFYWHDLEIFINKAIECSRQNVGVAEYTISITNGDLSFDKTFQIGYTESSFNFFNGSIDVPDIIV